MKILFTGDINFRGQTNLDFEKSKIILSEVLPFVQNADFVIPNLESPLANREKHKPIYKSGPNLIGSTKHVCFLNALRANVVTLANNHIGDFGPAAVEETIQLLKANHMQHAGAGRNISEAYEAAHIEKDDIYVSILSVCENEFGMATETKSGSAGYSPRRLMNQIKKEKQCSDYVIVVFHGGNEYNPLPSPDTVERYRFICDMGADAVIATHPHCPQGYEIYKGKPIVYSMGNFLFKSAIERASNNAWYYGYMSLLDIQEKITLSVIPYRFNPTADWIHVFSGNNRIQMLVYIQRLSEFIQNEKELKELFKGWAWGHQWCPKIPENPAKPENYHAAPNYNLVKSESHLNQLQTLLEIFLNNEIEQAKKMYEKVLELQRIPV